MQKLSQTEELARELASHARRHTVTPEQISRAMDEKDYDVAQLDELGDPRRTSGRRRDRAACTGRNADRQAGARAFGRRRGTG